MLRPSGIPVLPTLIILLITGSSQGRAAGLRESRDSWLLSTGESWLLLGAVSADLTRIPGRASLVTLAGGGGRLFSIPGLEQTCLQVSSRVRFRGRGLFLAGEWQQLGRGIFREERKEFRILAGNFPALGLGVVRRQVMLSGETVSGAFDCCLHLDFPFPPVRGTCFRCRLELPLAGSTRQEVQQSRRGFLLLTLIRGGRALVLQVDRRQDGTPVLGLDSFWCLGGGLGIGLRADPATGSVGPSLSLRRGNLLVRTSHLVHPSLGQTHRVSLGLVFPRG